jgi:hypothetical protein
MDIEPYRSIMNLLEICRSFIPDFNGLTHAHFLYALSDKKSMKLYKQKEMKEYFSNIFVPSIAYSVIDDLLHNSNTSEEQKKKLIEMAKKTRKQHIKVKTLENFYKTNKSSLNIYELKKECIKRPQRLNEKINFLINIGWIKPAGKPKHRRYFSTIEFQVFLKKAIINYNLGKLELKDLDKVENLVFELVGKKKQHQ